MLQNVATHSGDSQFLCVHCCWRQARETSAVVKLCNDELISLTGQHLIKRISLVKAEPMGHDETVRSSRRHYEHCLQSTVRIQLKRSFNCSPAANVALRTFFKAFEPGLVLPLALTKPMQNLATQIFEENCSLRLFFQISLFCIRLKIFPLFKKNAKRPKTDEIKKLS